jgi:hypothetical protein
MAGSANPSTFREAMQDVASDLARASMLPDADVKLAMQLYAAIVGWARHAGQAGGQQQQQQPGQPQPGQSQPGAPGGAPPGLQMPGAAPGGASPNPAQPTLNAPVYGALGRGTANVAPDPDELRRVLSTLQG